MKIPTYHAQRQSLDVEMTPMIDVVFLLLVFFLWTASFQMAEQLLPSSLSEPTSTAGQTEQRTEQTDFEPIVVRLVSIDGRVQFELNQQQHDSLEKLESILSAVTRVKLDIPVVVDPDVDVPLGSVIDVYDLARRLGCEKVRFTASDST